MKKYVDKDDIKVLVGHGEESIFVNAKKGDRLLLDDGTIVKVGISKEEWDDYINRRLKIATSGPIKRKILTTYSKIKDKNIRRRGKII